MKPSSSIGPTTFLRRKQPRPREAVFDLYWIFASRRNAIFERRLAGDRAPWTDDPILRAYKFCNVFRAADRVSQYMIRDVIYGDDPGDDADRMFRIVAFRTFSSPRTWKGVRSVLGRAPTLNDLRSGAFEVALNQVRRSFGGLYTGAFILCANKAFGHDAKHLNHVALFKRMFLEEQLQDAIAGANSLERVVRLLEAFPLMGPFMAYQTAIDINYSNLTAFDEDDFTQAGPGALRGLAKAFIDLGDYSPSDTIRWMVENQDVEFARLELPFNGLFGRKLHAIDCQGLFCELDKYCREAAPQLTSNRTRIKARFSSNAELPKPFFPPKWGLNDRVPSDRTTAPWQPDQYRLSFV